MTSDTILSPRGYRKGDVNFGDELGMVFLEMGLKDDPLDESDEFDVVDYINTRFPDMDSLQNMNEYSDVLKQRLTRLDSEIYSAVRENANAALHGISEITNLNEAIGDLSTRVVSIRERAEESEKIVKTVSRDIVFLDTAKRNVSLTINTLKRMVMMVNACEQLAELAGAREYAQTSALVCSIRDLEKSFDDIKQIPRIAELLKHKDRILNDLRLQLIEDYDNRIYLSYTSVDSNAALSSSSRIIPSREDVEKIDFVGAAETVDALGLDVRLEIINKYCLEVIEEYRKNFAFPSGQFAALSFYEKRFQWLSKALKEYTDKHSSLFPNSWIINGEICMLFCHETRQHFVDILSHEQSSGTEAADLMVTVLVKCMELENDMQRRFDKLQKSYPSPLSHPLVFKSVISACFEAYLGQWVVAQEEQFSSLIAAVYKAGPAADELLGEVGKSQPPSPRDNPTSRQSSLDDSDPPMVYISAVNLFAQMRASLQRCRQFTSGQIMVDLFSVFKKGINLYCEKVLKSRLPTPNADKHHPDDASSQQAFLGRIQTVCAVIGSCDYCLKMTPFLHKSCMSFLDKILDISNEIQKLADFREYAQESAIMVIVRELRSVGIVPISQADWWNRDSAASVSPHVAKLRIMFELSNRNLKKNLADNHYKAIIESICHKVISQLTETVYTAKPISDTGAQQLIVDVAEIKSILLDSSHKHQQTYIDMVQRGFHRLEISLKALSSPASGDKQSLKAILSSLDSELAKSEPSLDKEVDRLLSLRKPPAPTVAALFTRDADHGGITIGRKSSSENFNNHHNPADMVSKLMSGKLFGSIRK